MNNILLLLIDAQKDFTNPFAPLFVPNSVGDMMRLSNFIDKNVDKIDHIICSLDSHIEQSIFFPSWFVDKNQNNPKPFTQITLNDVNDGIWMPVNYKNETIYYLQKLEENDNIKHTIWPKHCIIGTHGHNLNPYIETSLERFTYTNKTWKPIIKGLNPFTENYGIFCSEVTLDGYPETSFNYKLLDELTKYEYIYIAGEAKSHCVALTIKQIIDNRPQLVKNLIILTDAMSPVTGFEHISDDVYKEAEELGAIFKTTNDEILVL